jgi:hypothetical protein
MSRGFMFTSKLLKSSSFDTDMTNPDGSRHIEFSLELGLPEYPDWEITIIQKNDKTTMIVKDEGRSRVDMKSLDDCHQALTRRIQAFADQLKSVPKYKDRYVLIQTKLIKQLDSYFDTLV